LFCSRIDILDFLLSIKIRFHWARSEQLTICAFVASTPLGKQAKPMSLLNV